MEKQIGYVRMEREGDRFRIYSQDKLVMAFFLTEDGFEWEENWLNQRSVRDLWQMKVRELCGKDVRLMRPLLWHRLPLDIGPASLDAHLVDIARGDVRVGNIGMTKRARLWEALMSVGIDA